MPKGAACAAIVPSRGRPGPLGEFLDAFTGTSVCSELYICLDDDDTALPGYETLMDEPRFARHLIHWISGPGWAWPRGPTGSPRPSAGTSRR